MPLRVFTFVANAVRYGTARAEWFLNFVRVSISSVSRVPYYFARPSSSRLGRSSRHAEGLANLLLDLTLPNYS